MPMITHREFISAPIDKCFELARDVETIMRTAPDIKQKAVGGVTSGLLEKGDIVTWETVHFGIRTQLSSQMIVVERPHLFKDSMVKGLFHSFTHTHEFIEVQNGTWMIDRFDYSSPLSLLGVMADQLFLKRYMQNFIRKRAGVLKVIAESEDV
ncbi:cell division protein [Sporosarcina sp. P13]|uniref:SRPBCC family protein n=1 Tax=Sporosarcina sp. P13 TaxID=2048263 RepID=UPI000C164D06|nr:SRPBCC family protein [Sporosarcina sp. P13]PIC63838.1 cell division protein [Sporosarcina sp. P13]